jgi:hypothetical protein
MRGKPWVVYAKPPFGSPEQVLKYLARYTHRVAISNRRIVSVGDDHVAFRYLDRASGNTMRTMTLSGAEFLRRFLLHVLPKGFVRIRHFGLLANRARKTKLARCRELLGTPATTSPTPNAQSDQDAEDHAPSLCPNCGVGHMYWVQKLSPTVAAPERRPRGPPEHP